MKLDETIKQVCDQVCEHFDLLASLPCGGSTMCNSPGELSMLYRYYCMCLNASVLWGPHKLVQVLMLPGEATHV